jgi:hypothetical protein
MITLPTLKTLFPVSNKNNSSTGRIPMEYFEANEKEIRAIMREHKLKSIYRGPRITNRRSNYGQPTMTRRCDATAVLLYRR